MRRLERSYSPKLVALAVAAALLTFAPILKSFYVSDDALLGQFSRFDLTALLNVIVFETLGWWKSVGRLLVVSTFANYLPLVIFDDRADYKLFCYTANIVLVFAFSWLLFRLYGSRVATVFPIFLAFVFQLRDYHDAALAFGALYQVTLLLMVFSALAAIKYSENGGWAIFVSVIFMVLALLTMEVAYSLIPFLIYVASKSHNKYRFRFALLSYIFAAISVFVLARYGAAAFDPVPGFVVSSVSYSPRFDISLVATTFAKQVISGFPLNYFIFEPRIGSWGVVSDPFVQEISIISITSIMLLCGLASMFLLSSIDLLENSARSVSAKDALIMFILVGVFPAAVISISPKYQSELIWGIGYLPVYIQYFGVAASLSIIYVFMLPTLRENHRVTHYTLIVGIVVAIGMGSWTNWRVVFAQRLAWHIPLAADNLVLNTVYEGAVCQDRVLFVPKDSPWVNDQKFLVRRLGVSGVIREIAGFEGEGCFFDSAFSTPSRIATLLGPVQFKDGELLILDNTRRFTGLADRALVQYCDKSCLD